MVGKTVEMRISFDAEADVLYCSLGEPQEAISIEREDGIIVRVQPETEEVVGFTIIDFSKRFAGHPQEILRVPLQATPLPSQSGL